MDPQSAAARVGNSGSTRRGQRQGPLPPPARPRSNAPTHVSGRLRQRKISGSARPPTRTAHAPAAAPHAAALGTRAPTGLARPKMAAQTRTGAARDRRATEQRTHHPPRRPHARSRGKEPLKHENAPFHAHTYLCDATAAPRRRPPAPPPPPAASPARPASNALHNARNYRING